MRSLVRDLPALAAAGEGRAELRGWVHRVRDLGGVSFVMLRDRSGVGQVVAAGGLDLPLESVVAATGVPAANPRAPGGWELRDASIEVLSPAERDLPYPVNGDPSKIGLDVVLDRRPLSLRNPKIRAVFRVQATIVEAFGDYLRSLDFTEIKTSKLVGGGTEGGSGLFKVDYFGSDVFLAQSPQFYKQTMVASGLERVFEVAPAYRAEKHDTARHLNEYVSLDVEMAFIDSELDLIELEKGLLANIFGRLERDRAEELALWGASVPSAAQVAAAPVVGHDEALALASAAAGTRAFEITPEVERQLCAWAEREKGVDLVFVNAFPRRDRPFYAHPAGASSTLSFDALFRGLEITTGGRRIESYGGLLESMARHGLKEEDMEDYLSVFKYGCPPHGGFAIGLERLTARVLGLANVKEASLFPRDRKRVRP